MGESIKLNYEALKGTNEALSNVIVDTKTEEALGPNTLGELRIKSKDPMPGYHDKDASDCWDSEGFFKTGDVAYYDEDYCFYIVDRLKELLKFRNWHISPVQLESVIAEHPAVAKAVVVGIPHETHGDLLMAVVVLKNDDEQGRSAAKEDIPKFVEERVADHQRLRAGLKFVEQFPLTPAGKVDRRRIKRLAMEGNVEPVYQSNATYYIKRLISCPRADVLLKRVNYSLKLWNRVSNSPEICRLLENVFLVVKNNRIHFRALDIPKLEGLGKTLFNKMIENDDAIAQIDARSGEKESFAFLCQKCTRVAIKMRSKGLVSGDIVSICSFNNLNTAVPYLAGLFLNIKTASLDPNLSPADSVYLLGQVRPKMIFVDRPGLELIEKITDQLKFELEIVAFGESEEHTSFDQFLEASPQEEAAFEPVDVDVHDTAVIMFSSGTTGLPKAICLKHFSLLGTSYQNHYPFYSGEILLVCSSMYWISAVYFINYAILNKVARLVCPKFNTRTVWIWIKDYKVNALFLAPCQLLEMCKYGKPERADIPTLKYIVTGGGPLAANQLLAVRRHFKGTIICKIYGLTEINGGGLMFRFSLSKKHMQLLLERPESSGTGVPESTYKIVDLESEEALGPNQVGELRIRSAFQMKGYHNVDSTDCWDSEGFLKTGDVAYYDEDYCFYIVDRIKDMLKYRAWQVAPAQIESVLLEHPAVLTGVVIGSPHPIDGDLPMAVVVLKYECPEEDIVKYVGERVDDRKQLRGGVKIVQKLPMTPSGKIDRRKLRLLVNQEDLQTKFNL